MYEHEAAVLEYQHERTRPRQADALLFLRKVASLVKPIMRRRGWRVHTLAEFYPEERNLLGLNVNRGERICLRLRYPTDHNLFLPLEEVTDTMLHELCHNVHGPHNEAFHNLWNQLRDEHENLARKGYTGEGFLSAGNKLGGQRIPIEEARRRARATAVAAEQRRTAQSALSGHRLGGRPTRRDEDIRRTIADAATRRITVTRGCASGTTSKQRELEIVDGLNRNSTRTKAEQPNENEEAIMIAYIDLVQEEERAKYGSSYSPPTPQNPTGSHHSNVHPPPAKKTAQEIAAAELSRLKASNHHSPVLQATPTSRAVSPNVLTSSKAPAPTYTDQIDLTQDPTRWSEDWECGICTLLNPSTNLCCLACGIDRPSPPGSPIHRSGSGGANHNLSRSAARNTNSQNKSSDGIGSGHLGGSNTQKAIRTLRHLDAQEARSATGQTLLWQCGECGQWMEREWWVCRSCSAVKSSS